MKKTLKRLCTGFLALATVSAEVVKRQTSAYSGLSAYDLQEHG